MTSTVPTEPTNYAAWLNRARGRLEPAGAPYTAPGDDYIVVRNRAVAVNPIDWIIQVAGTMAYRWLAYPAVVGSDSAGEVVQVGENVTRFRVGDRVVGHAVGTDKDSNSAAQGTFQHYTVLLERMASPIPDGLDFASAAVLPLGVSTAACALFQSNQLGLQYPGPGVPSTGHTVLIWGGSTSVGTNAIQLAVAAGYDVVTTCSPRNFDFVRSLGAAEVFDYNAPTVVPDIIAAFRDRTLAGAIAIGTTSANACLRIVAGCTGRKFVSVATPPVSFAGLADEHRTRFTAVRTVSRLITSNIALHAYARPRRIGLEYIFGTSLKNNDVSNAIYRDFLPAALAEGRYLALPHARIVGNGLIHLQEALDVQRRGVSATKIVVTLDTES
ncbi:MAG: zinc-binding alcohol dehydrogenase family protein [Rhodococcus sp. (in: high G+C Gram-positive bacteria)]